jgi:hypothetical protein
MPKSGPAKENPKTTYNGISHLLSPWPKIANSISFFWELFLLRILGAPNLGEKLVVLDSHYFVPSGFTSSMPYFLYLVPPRKMNWGKVFQELCLITYAYWLG